MKFLLALCVALCVAGVYCETHEEMMAQVAECATQHNIDIKQFEVERKNPNFTPTRPMNCFAACVLKKRQMMDENGKFTPLFEQSEISKECKPEYGQDECETGSKFMMCLIKSDMYDKLKGKSS